MNGKKLAAILASAALPVFAVNYETLVKSAESTDGKAPISSLWQRQNAKELAAATSEAAIVACTDSAEAAAALLARVKPAYATDPLDACLIAEVTHWVMVDAGSSWYEFWREHRGDRRKVWADALLKAVEGAADEYVAIFCLDQLRWCGSRCQVERLRALGAKAKSKPVAEFVRLLVRELEGDRIGG